MNRTLVVKYLTELLREFLSNMFKLLEKNLNTENDSTLIVKKSLFELFREFHTDIFR